MAVLEQRTAGLQAELGKLSESGYLEDLARQQLTYALPGEELYVVGDGEQQRAPEAGVTEDPGGVFEEGYGASTLGAEGLGGESAVADGADNVSAADAGTVLVSGATGSEPAEGARPGMLERMLLAISNLF